MRSNPLPPLPQDYFDDNRETYGAETSIAPLDSLNDKCRHYLVRISGSELKCKRCPAFWIDAGRFDIQDGLIKTVK